MNASIALLLDKAGLAGASVWDFRDGDRSIAFDIRCAQGLGIYSGADLEHDVLYVVDSAALPKPADGLVGASIIVAGEFGRAEEFARSCRCRVIAVPEFRSSRMLHNAIVAAQRTIDDLDVQLMWASLEKDPLGSMLPIIADELREPVLATDADDVLVAFAAPEGLEISDEVFSHILSHNCILPDVPLFDTFLATMPAGETLRSTVPLVRVPGTGREYLNAMVLHDGNPLINILASNEGGRFEPSAADMMLRFKLLVEHAVAAGSPLGFPPPEKDSCVRRLLDHIFVREEIIEGYLRKRGWVVDDRYFCVLAQIEGDNANAMLPFLARQLRSGVMRDAVVLVHGTEVACVAHAEDCPYDIGRLTAELGAAASRFSARMGVSCPFHDFRELRRYYDSCRTAISYGVQENPQRTVSFFDDYAARHLEKVLFNRSINEVLLDARAHDLKRYDEEHGGDLLRTLLVYLEYGQNKTLAAQQLFVHRNTLVYRIGVIEKVTGIDLETLDADRLFHLMYTCRYLLYRQ